MYNMSCISYTMKKHKKKKKSTDAVIEILLLYTPYCWIDIYKVYGFWHEYTHMKQHAP